MALARFFDRIYAAAGRMAVADRQTLATKLQGTQIAVALPERGDANSRWTSELLVSLLARLYPSLSIAGHGAGELQSLARAINPSVDLAARSEKPTAAVLVGAAPAVDCGVMFRATSAGWLAAAGVGTEGVEGPANPLAAGAAACFAAAAVFRHIFLQPIAEQAARVSLLDYGTAAGADEALPPVDLGRCVLAGAGAVGNSVLWALSRLPDLHGSIHILDPEKLELSNLQRYVLCVDTDVDRPKTEIAASGLASTALSVTSASSSLESATLDGPIDALVVTVDNVRGRRVAQAMLPRLAINGWTSETGLGASWHDFRSSQACLACLYHPAGPTPSQTDLVASALGLPPLRASQLWVFDEPLNTDDLVAIAAHLKSTVEALAPWRSKGVKALYSDVICGAAPVPMRPGAPDEAVPLAHQSALAGILAAAELIKHRLGLHGDAPNLVAWHDVRRRPPAMWLQPRSQVTGCICGDPVYRRIYERKWPTRPL